MIYGIKFNGKHSLKDMGFTMSERAIGSPAKNKITVSVPFSNTPLDFSEIYGSQTYTERPLTYTFNIVNTHNLTPEAFMMARTRLENWLMNSNGKQRLYDETMPGYYFLAEMQDAADIQDDWETGTLTATFTAYPFKIADLPEGNDIWDNFNFELDVAQQVKFEVNGSLTINLINAGTPEITPDIKASSPMFLKKGNLTLDLPTGTNRSDDFTLEHGENEIVVTGNGSIEFVFYKELL
jgi:phage-related protein